MATKVKPSNKSANTRDCKTGNYKGKTISSSEPSNNDYKLSVVSNEHLENMRRKTYKYIM